MREHQDGHKSFDLTHDYVDHIYFLNFEKFLYQNSSHLLYTFYIEITLLVVLLLILEHHSNVTQT